MLGVAPCSSICFLLRSAPKSMRPPHGGERFVPLGGVTSTLKKRE